MINVRKRPMCWIAIGFLLIICILTLGRSKDNIPLENIAIEENDRILLEGSIVSKEYKDTTYGGYWQIILKKVKITWEMQEKQHLKSHEEDIKQENPYREQEEADINGVRREVRSIEGKYLCQITGTETPELKIGQRILLEAKYAPWERPTNEGQFDSKKYYISQGVLGQFKKGKVIRSGTDYYILREKMWQLRQNMQEILQRCLGNRDGGLIGAMLLGDKSDLNEEDKSLYQRNGISHILAISGLHLSLLGMGIYKILARFMPGKKSAAILCIFIMSLYCIFTGNSISTNRATIMFALSLLAVILGRSYDSLSALGLTAILQLFINPYVLSNSGFLLSFLAVIGVTFLAPRMQELFLCKKSFEKSLIVSLSATLTTLPVILTSYGTYPWYSVFLNLLVLPAMSLLLFCSVLMLGVSGMFLLIHGNDMGIYALLDMLAAGYGLLDLQISGHEIFGMQVSGKTFATFILYGLKIIIKLILKYFELCCEGFEKLIFQDGIIGAPSWIAICIYGVLLFIAASNKIIHSTFFRKMLLLCALSILTTRFQPGVEITMLDVGQGDCVVVRNSNGNVYISDCGSSNVSKVGKYRLLPFLKYKGYGRIKGIFISHMDEDHMSGILELLESSREEHVSIEYLFLPESVLVIEEDRESLNELLMLASKNGTKVIYLGQGEEIQDGELQFSCIYPVLEDSAFSGLATENMGDVFWKSVINSSSVRRLDRNNSSLVLLLQYQDFEMLFTGDVEEEGEEEILEYLEQQERSELEGVKEENNYEDSSKQNKVDGLNEQIKIDVLKVAHHGSSGSSSEEFLEVFQPRLSLISCGRNNSYGHPHEETLERLKNTGSRIMTTVDSGAITIKIHGRRVKIKEYKHNK